MAVILDSKLARGTFMFRRESGDHWNCSHLQNNSKYYELNKDCRNFDFPLDTFFKGNFLKFILGKKKNEKNPKTIVDEKIYF